MIDVEEELVGRVAGRRAELAGPVALFHVGAVQWREKDDRSIGVERVRRVESGADRSDVQRLDSDLGEFLAVDLAKSHRAGGAALGVGIIHGAAVLAPGDTVRTRLGNA